MAWQPLLEGELKDRAKESVVTVLEALATRQVDPAGAASLAGGAAGLAVLYGYLAQTEGGQDHVASAVQCLQRATAAAADNPGSASLYSGLAGVGWAMAHLQGRLPELDGHDELDEIDQALLEHLQQSPWPDTYDLIDGLVGFGVYALERGLRGEASACLERVIERLAETAEQRADGTTWVSCQEWLPTQYRERYPHRYYNLGLAHGVPGVVALLALACAADVAVAKARPLLDGTVRWLLAQQTSAGFPSGVAIEHPHEPARLAWCYGDPGVAAALLWAARLVDEPAWEQEALAIAIRSAQRPAKQSGVVDAGLCHGAAGLGHLFNRMFQATHEAGLAEAARFWFERTLRMRRPGKGIGGYEAWGPGVNDEMTWVADPSLLTGAAGIALALVAATTSMEPDWDRMLLVAVPTVAARVAT
jgi:lantibiotic modifying enzyme